jgi:23S rRNA (uridine2552-2'-O)-methyltransferase
VARSKSSSRWISRQSRDQYVAKAKAEGYRSRAVYKLQEIDAKYQIFQSNQFIVDLGAAPGAWCQYVVRNVVGTPGKIIGLDILEMEPIDGVCLIQGDFTEDETLDQLVSSLNNHPVDLVLSDIAPNISGNKAVDQPKSMYLAELALDFARQHLTKGGVFAVKLFQGEGYAQYIQELRSSFKRVSTFKPQASRKESREMYAIAREFEL